MPNGVQLYDPMRFAQAKNVALGGLAQAGQQIGATIQNLPATIEQGRQFDMNQLKRDEYKEALAAMMQNSDVAFDAGAAILDTLMDDIKEVENTDVRNKMMADASSALDQLKLLENKKRLTFDEAQNTIAAFQNMYKNAQDFANKVELSKKAATFGTLGEAYEEAVRSFPTVLEPLENLPGFKAAALKGAQRLEEQKLGLKQQEAQQRALQRERQFALQLQRMKQQIAKADRDIQKGFEPLDRQFNTLIDAGTKIEEERVQVTRRLEDARAGVPKKQGQFGMGVPYSAADIAALEKQLDLLNDQQETLINRRLNLINKATEYMRKNKLSTGEEVSSLQFREQVGPVDTPQAATETTIEQTPTETQTTETTGVATPTGQTTTVQQQVTTPTAPKQQATLTAMIQSLERDPQRETNRRLSDLYKLLRIYQNDPQSDAADTALKFLSQRYPQVYDRLF